MVVPDRLSLFPQRTLRAVAGQRQEEKGGKIQTVPFKDNRENSQLAGQIQAIQRRVRSFTSTTTDCKTPNQQLKEAIKEPQIIDKSKMTDVQMGREIDQLLTITGSGKKVTKVDAVLNSNVTHSITRDSSKSQIIGAIGHDEYMLRFGKPMAFEGGHLISHHLWDQGDEKKDKADSYENLVPMSRTLNIGDYSRNVESHFDHNKYKQHIISCTYTPYKVPERHIAVLFDWPLLATGPIDACFTIDPAIPDKYEHSEVDATTGTEILSEASESDQISPVPLVTNKVELCRMLETRGLLQYLSSDMIDSLKTGMDVE